MSSNKERKKQHKIMLMRLAVMTFFISSAIFIYSTFVIVNVGFLGNSLRQYSIAWTFIAASLLLTAAVVAYVGSKDGDTPKSAFFKAYLGIAILGACGLLAAGGVMFHNERIILNVRNRDARSEEEATFQDFSLAVYTKCCDYAFYFPGAVSCQFITFDMCMFNEAFVEKTALNLDSSICEHLSTVKIDGNAIVGGNTDDILMGRIDVLDGCGGGDKRTFVRFLSDYFVQNFGLLAVTNVIVAVATIISVGVIYCASSTDNKADREVKNVDAFENEKSLKIHGTEVQVEEYPEAELAPEITYAKDLVSNIIIIKPYC